MENNEGGRSRIQPCKTCTFHDKTTTNAPLFSWPWENLGNYKYLLYGPLVMKFIYGGGEEDSTWCLHVLILTALRCSVHQLWSSFSDMLFVNRARRIFRQGIDFEQKDLEWHWDNFIMLQAIMASLAYLSSPCLANLPIGDARGFILCLVLHVGVSEPLYYWLHRALHSPNLFQRYHWLHHSSKVPHPFTAGHAAFFEHLMFCIVIGVPTLGTAFIGYGSISIMYGYVLVFDFLRCLGHCNVDVVPYAFFESVPPLKYLIRTSPDFVFLAHVVDIMSAMHAPFFFRSFSSTPFRTRWFLIPFWPVTFLVMLLMWAKSKTFLFSFYNLRSRLHQTWAVPRFGFQYFLPFAAQGINSLIEDAILRADRLGVKVLTLAALNKNERLNGGGTLFVNKHPNLKVRVVHGNTMTAAVILHSIPQHVDEVFLTGATSKLGRAIALYLANRRVKVLMLTQSTERFLKIQQEAAADYAKFLVHVTGYQDAKHCKTWIIGKRTTRREQSWAPAGTHFHQFVVPPIAPSRGDCTYGNLAAMKLPADVEGLGSCEYTLGRGVVHACHAGGVVHLLQGWRHHEVGPIQVDQIDLVWEAALTHGLQPL